MGDIIQTLKALALKGAANQMVSVSTTELGKELGPAAHGKAVDLVLRGSLS